jgi:hypothetical protein
MISLLWELSSELDFIKKENPFCFRKGFSFLGFYILVLVDKYSFLFLKDSSC